MSTNHQSPAVPAMLLRRYAEEGDREAIRNAVHGFAAGDPDTFPVRFAVLLEAHATAMELAPEVLKQKLGRMLSELRDLMLAYQVDMRQSAAKVTNTEAVVRQELEKHRDAIWRELAELRQEIKRVGDSGWRAQQAAEKAEQTAQNNTWQGQLVAAGAGVVATILVQLLFHFLVH